MLVAALLTTAFLLSVPKPSAPREFRAAWVATVDNIDWPSKKGLPVEKMREELLGIIKLADELKLNALVFQIRPSCDALYKSEIEPWSEYLTGEQGKAPAGNWDPLKYAVDECHARGIELHAWFNPYRAWHPAAKGRPATNFIGLTNPNLVKTYGKYQWLDPGEKEVQNRSYNVFLDVVKRYEVDGIHFDDYFYPYPEKGLEFPDADSYSEYQELGGNLGRSDWRRKNVDDFIRRVHTGIKATKPRVKFGISPFGIYRPGIPEGIQAGIDQYEALYADALKWLKEGWCDYFTPQLYWPIDQKPQSYPVLLNWWVSQTPKGKFMWPGNYTSRLNDTARGYSAEEVLRQIEVTRNTPGATGNVHFSFKAFTQNWRGINEKLKAGPYAKRALIPAAAGTAPGKPQLTKTTGGFRAVGGIYIAQYRETASGMELVRVAPSGATFDDEKGAIFTALSSAWVESASVEAK